MSEPKEPRGRKEDEREFTYEEIEHKLETSANMRKYYSTDQLHKWVSKLGLTEEEERLFYSNLSNMPGREHNHILRMLGRPGVEKDFGLAFCKYNRNTLFSEEGDSSLFISKVINSEGVDTTLFWTFAPHLFQALRQKGLEDNEAMKLILVWAKDGVSTGNHGRTEDSDWGTAHLKGLDKIRKYHTGYILDEDPNHVSHKFTAQEARHIADMLVEE